MYKFSTARCKVVVEENLEIRMPGKSKNLVVDKLGEQNPNLAQFAQEKS